MQVNTLIQLIKSSGPRLNGKATRVRSALEMIGKIWAEVFHRISQVNDQLEQSKSFLSIA